jgi:hypothetical protein
MRLKPDGRLRSRRSYGMAPAEFIFEDENDDEDEKEFSTSE